MQRIAKYILLIYYIIYSMKIMELLLHLVIIKLFKAQVAYG